MPTRRQFLRTSAAVSASAAAAGATSSQGAEAKENTVTLKPYSWKGPYADYRTRHKALHDWRLCAEVRTDWLLPCEKIVLRTSEVIGHDGGFLYDDHFPPSEPEGRGKNYRHIPFEWRVAKPNQKLFTDCLVPHIGKFTMRLEAQDDYLDIHLSIRNDLAEPMHNPDWAFCAVAFETFSIADTEDERTYLFDGERLRTLGGIAGRDMKLYKVAGANGFIPVGHRALPIGPVEAKASVVILEAVDGVHTVALGFEQADHIYGDAKGNKCFHADPYFGALLKSGEERKMRGRLYLMKGTAQDALSRYQQDFRG